MPSIQVGVDKGSYTFDSSAKTITFTALPELTDINQISLVVNATDNIPIYRLDKTTLNGTLSGSVLTLDYDTTTMSDTDSLMIFVRLADVDTPPVPVTLQIPGNKILYDEMDYDQSITKDSYTTIYSDTGAGKLYYLWLYASDNDMFLKVILDGVEIISGLSFRGIYSDYEIQANNFGLSPWIFSGENGKMLGIDIRTGAAYSNSLIIQMLCTQNNKKLERGLVVRELP